VFPRRGALAALITTIALLALLNYKTPDLQIPADPAAIADDPNAAPSLVALGGDASPSDGVLGIDGYWPSPAGHATAGQTATTNPTTAGHTPTPGHTPAPGATPAPGRTSAPPAPTHAPTAKPPAPPPPQQGFTGSVTGAAYTMKYGTVQVRATFSNGKLTDVAAVKTPTGDSHSVAIAAHAVPILRAEALSAQSANIHTVSGATYTSKAYISSLQSAIAGGK
jgi:uncharacterized protein with FMN-binding domain